MKYIFLSIFAVVIFSCENNSFDRDKRQLVAKNEIREKLGNIQAFDITAFKEDTLHDYSPAFHAAIRYKLDVAYKDSTGAPQNKEAFVIFTPDGKSVISAEINH